MAADPLGDWLRVGLIADVQHADIDDMRSGCGLLRHYRDATTKARLAAADWRASGCKLAVNLGDTVDRRGGSDAPAALARVLAEFAGFEPLLHIPGNHDLALPPAEVAQLDPRRALEGLEADVGPGRYCDVHVGPRWRILVIDTYDVAYQRDPEAAEVVWKQLLAEERQKGGPTQHLTLHQDLNGAVGEAQMAWIRSRLTSAAANAEQVVVLSHAPFLPDATQFGDALCWNWREVSALLDEFPQVVAAVISGHDHLGKETMSEVGIYHRVLEAAMTGELGTPTHAILEMRGDEVRLVGRGSVKSWTASSLGPALRRTGTARDSA